jgi:hypothetical protein
MAAVVQRISERNAQGKAVVLVCEACTDELWPAEVQTIDAASNSCPFCSGPLVVALEALPR